jgi:membrane protein implicated in regulation of membrane protease activity
MELDPGKPARSASFAFVVLGLVAICAGLGAMLYVTTSAAAGVTDVPVRKLLLRLAWGSLTLLCVALVLLVWAILRHIRQALAPSAPLPPSEYVNAWELAGKRFQLPEDEDEDKWRTDEEEGEEGGAEGEDGRK